MSSSPSRSTWTLGTRARVGWPSRVVVEPSACSRSRESTGRSAARFPILSLLQPSRSPLRVTLWREGLQGVQAIHPVRSSPCGEEGLFDDGGDVVVPPERGVQHRLVHCVVGPALYPAPAALAADQTMSSSPSRSTWTLGTRAGLVGEAPVVVEPSASSPCGVHWSLGCSFPNPLASSAITLTLAGHVVARGALRGFKQSTQYASALAGRRGYSTRSVESPTTSVNVAP